MLQIQLDFPSKTQIESLYSHFKFSAVDLEIVVNVVTKFVHTKPAREEKKYLLGVSGSILRINPPVVTRYSGRAITGTPGSAFYFYPRIKQFLHALKNLHTAWLLSGQEK